MKFITDLLTENDGSTWCFARVSSAIALASFIGFAGFNLCKDHKFEDLNYANGLMQILAGSAAIIGAKSIKSA